MFKEYRCIRCGQRVGVISGESKPLCNGGGKHKMEEMVCIDEKVIKEEENPYKKEDPCKGCSFYPTHVDYCKACRHNKRKDSK